MVEHVYKFCFFDFTFRSVPVAMPEVVAVRLLFDGFCHATGMCIRSLTRERRFPFEGTAVS